MYLLLLNLISWLGFRPFKENFYKNIFIWSLKLSFFLALTRAVLLNLAPFQIFLQILFRGLRNNGKQRRNFNILNLYLKFGEVLVQIDNTYVGSWKLRFFLDDWSLHIAYQIRALNLFLVSFLKGVSSSLHFVKLYI